MKQKPEFDPANGFSIRGLSPAADSGCPPASGLHAIDTGSIVNHKQETEDLSD